MKKMSIYLIIVVALFGLIFILNQSDKNALYGKPSSQLNPATKAQLKDPNYQNIILPAELNSRVQSGEEMFVYFFASDCSHCKNTTPVLMPIAQDLGIDLPQFNLREFQEYFGKYEIEYTPTLVYYKDGKQVERLEGGISLDGGPGYTKEDYIDFFNRNKEG
ncbi:thioredoxin family protein [Paenibacillus sp. GCM10012307]|uniref:Thioredoxin family protein n=1 Tax=Paenibacillus roseus TaxID=2798579 RepID=A0A934J1R6_9BACL|nr:thioredoxin family protein [Paenibacillus roseus]MBJ6359868.1 thioredoxin family protein [Paenibacillus roseus]